MRPLAWIVGVFLVVYFLPVEQPRFGGAVAEALALTRWYTREHVLLCLVPALLIAGAISVFLSEGAVLKYLGPRAANPVARPSRRPTCQSLRSPRSLIRWQRYACTIRQSPRRSFPRLGSLARIPL